HGFADLAPLRLDTGARTLYLTVRPPGGAPRRIRIAPGPRRTARVRVLGGGAPTTSQRAHLARAATDVLRLDQDLSGLYGIAADDPDLAWIAAGAGRMLRSPTVWEDVVKTVCTTNCSWGLTTKMVTALVTHLGEPAAGHRADPLTNAFPTPEVMAAQPESFYREVVRSGYRAPVILRLAGMVAAGEIDIESLASVSREDLSDDQIEQRLLDLPGVGPYAAAHIQMTLGRNSRLILDSWTRPTYARLTGRIKVPADTTIARRFRRYGPEAGLAFWLFVTRDWVI
ncbi:MAG: Fe-S cluster assembly protein HesB, partial [Actinomycetota bacterium]